MTRHPFIRLGVAADTTITVSRSEVNDTRPQGIVLEADDVLRVGEMEATRLVLWSTTSPPSVDVHTAAAGELRIWHVWRDGDLIQAWEAGAGLTIDDAGDDLGLCCHDGHGDAAVDLVVRLSFDRAWTQPPEAT